MPSIQTVCQWLLLVWLAATFFVNSHRDFHGRKSCEPGGFSGLVATVIATAVMWLLPYGAGCFDALTGIN